MEITALAEAFAHGAHAGVGQKRKYNGEDYIVHPREVVKIVALYVGNDPIAIAAAYLHDVVEDTAVTIEKIEREFGSRVAKLVSELTDVSKPEDGNRAKRKEIDRMHSANASATGQTIKVADIISNTRSIVPNDPDFAKVYLNEISLLLDLLTKAHPELRAIAYEQLSSARIALNNKLNPF